MTLDSALQSLGGGLLIGAGAAALLLLNGKIAGVSGILANVVGRQAGEQGWRLAFVIGLVLPAIIWGVGSPRLPASWHLALVVRFASRSRHARRQRLHQRTRRLRPRESLAAFARGHARFHVDGNPDGVHRATRNRNMRFLTAMIAGTLFGAGLLISGMTDPANVLGFLDIFGDWRPELALVMAGAALAAAPAFFFVRRKQRNLLGESVTLPDRRRINRALLLGAGLFGIGWGLSGICPGPGLVLLASGQSIAWIFIAAVSAGLLLGGRYTAAN